jgi:nucleotide-binding universal stress UspA family protein
MENLHDKINRIIILVDLAEGSDNLVEFGLHLSDMINAYTIIVHQVTALYPAMTEKKYKENIYQDKIDESTEKLRKMVKGRLTNHISFVVSPKPILTILSEIKSYNHSDWVVGKLKESNIIKRLLLGSTFINIINDTDLLTIAVPSPNPITVPEKILVAVTHKYSINQLQLDNLFAALRKHMTHIEFFTILDDDEYEEIENNYLLLLQTKYTHYNPQIKLIKGIDTYAELKKYVIQSKHSFLVLQEGSRSLFDELFRKCMINELIHTGSIPLIVLPNE